MAFSYSDIGNLSYIKRVTLDLSSGPSHLQIYAKQNDENSRYIEVTVIRNGEVLAIPDKTIARLRSKKANGKVVYAECAIHDNKVYADLSSVINTPGSAVTDVELTVVNQILSTQSFIVSTCKSPFDGAEIDDSDDLSAFQDAILRLAYLDENGVIMIPESYIQTLMLGNGIVTSEKIADETITPGKFDRSYWEHAYFIVTDFENLDNLISDASDPEDSLLNPFDALYELTFYPATDIHDIFGDDSYFGFISEYVGRDGIPKLTLINRRTFEMWSYLKGSGEVNKVTPSIGIPERYIQSYHIGEQEVYPENLRYNYLRLETLQFAGNSTHLVLTACADELQAPFETVYHIVSRGTGDIAPIGVGRCVGRFISISETGSVFAVRNLNTDKTYHINFTPKEITEIIDVTDNVIDTAINNKLAVFDLGEVMDFNHFISKSLIKKRVYRFTLGAGLKDKAGVGPFLGTYIENDYNNDGVIDSNIGENRIVKCMDLSSGVRWNIDLDNEKITKDITALSENIPSYWQATLEKGAEDINNVLTTVGYNKSAFLFYTDAHWDSGSKMSPKLLKYLYEHTGMTKINYGGDIVNSEAVGYDAMSYLWEWRNMLKPLPNHHSVVGNHDDGNSTNNLFSEQYVYGYLLASEETPDITRGEKGLYYYIDTPSEKTRYLYLDTAYKGVTTAQQEFIKNALLTTPEKWHIVAVAHIWHDTIYNDDGTTEIGDINSNASTVLSMLDAYNSRIGDYADCGGWVEFCIGGHTHVDYDSTSDTGIPIILVETDGSHIRSGLDYALETTSESSINGIIADYENHKIHVIRIGRGKSREVAVTNHVLQYTNLLPTAVSRTDINTVLTGDGTVGYLDAQRWSSSSNAFVSATVDTSGLIPVEYGDVVYLKNVTAYIDSTATNAGLSFFDSTGAPLSSASLSSPISGSFNAVYDDSGNLIQFSVPNWDGLTEVGFFSIACQDINGTSIITVNEPIE